MDIGTDDAFFIAVVNDLRARCSHGMLAFPIFMIPVKGKAREEETRTLPRAGVGQSSVLKVSKLYTSVNLTLKRLQKP